MASNRGTMSLGLPPFTPVVKRLMIVNAVVFLVVLIGDIGASNFEAAIFDRFGLVPRQAIQGLWIWQLVTYGFLHSGIGHLLVNMLSLWMFGSQLEMDWRGRRFTEFYFFCLIGAALTTIGLAYFGLSMAPSENWFLQRLAALSVTTTVGASGATYGLLLAFGMLYGERELFMFPLPIRIKAKYLVGIIVFVVLASALSRRGSSGVAEFAHLGGLVFGFIYVRFLGRHGVVTGASERYFGIRNSYYKWKRRRAAKKFEVYMRQYDRKQYFDEHGNYRPPQDDTKRGNGESRPPWVN